LERKHFRELRDRRIRICDNREFLANIKREFRAGDNEMIKMTELKKNRTEK